jgi:hypothetical protein
LDSNLEDKRFCTERQQASSSRILSNLLFASHVIMRSCMIWGIETILK